MANVEMKIYINGQIRKNNTSLFTPGFGSGYSKAGKNSKEIFLKSYRFIIVLSINIFKSYSTGSICNARKERFSKNYDFIIVLSTNIFKL